MFAEIKTIPFIEKFCLQENLSCYDPYDIWKTSIGKKIKYLFYKNKITGILPAATLTLFDLFLNNSYRFGYQKQEYPMVRALSALALLELFDNGQTVNYLHVAEKHIRWLVENFSKGYNGYCWGMNTLWVSKNGVYPPQTPYITNTPYVLEALIKYREKTGNKGFDPVIKSVFDFIEKDILVLKSDADQLALSYAPVKENRIVINANSYAMYCYALLLPYFPDKQAYIKEKILRLYNFIVNFQQTDGSWYYYADTLSGNFIDCFHSCFILKNIFKAQLLFPLNQADTIIQKGYNYVKNNFYDNKTKLARRFSISDKPSMVKYDLYDNAELLNVALLLKDHPLVHSLSSTIQNYFIINNDIYSIIDIFGIKRNKNTLRWAVLPYLYVLTMKLHAEKN
ncbi:MAG: hypothetical protein A3G23_12890 [Bacteroidetes bacterium RIFCSPLOWO2_12_FULL_37_12]|nr:MAG: hypothetical protein A3G23_12890 [Bacteroidetes bacterium RIFCSPLOWO2_12_FULL_37_12]